VEEMRAMIGELSIEQIAEIRALVTDSGAIDAPSAVHNTFYVAVKRHPGYGALSNRDAVDRCEVPISKVVDLMQTFGMVEIAEHTSDGGLSSSGRSFRFLVPPALVIAMMDMKVDVIRIQAKLDALLDQIENCRISGVDEMRR
jgi:hypothetical protein